ncbi:T9SS type B sorting domain-containing protein [Polaribacter sp. Hel_I_88]|uniref:T9SS type B sorting domain-containing protein n=1 Tax=Polaribacter sp. Hel_I_88 TaxID=1250006 RepID=UPI00068AF044|nr:T9SS type B sorting domain-containing protein [Polaribacter sp. Hel_I_88]
MKLKIIVFIYLFFFICVSSVNAQLSKKHFIPPLTYAENGNANPEEQFFYISTPKNQNVSYTIKQIGFPDNDFNGVVSSNFPAEIIVGTGNTQLFVDSRQTSVVHSDKGYIIEANDVIYVSIRVLAGGGAQAGALVSKGASALGTTFRAGMFTNENPQDNYLNFISVMASEDNTQVTFDDLPAGIEIKNYTGTLPISTTLNEGESYVVATNSFENTINRDGLIGTLINADKPIIVNTGSANGSFHNGGGRDYGIDQIVGADKIGTDYIFVKGNGNNDWENVLIVAHEDDTGIILNDGPIIATINKGEYYLIEGNSYNSNGNLYVNTSKPVFAYQGIGANNSEANQGLFFVPPLSCENRGKVDNIPKIESIGAVTFTGGITIVTNKDATVTINSQPISDFNTSGPFDVDGNPDYVTYKVINLTGDISIDSDRELYCAYFNQNGAATSGSFYSGFPSSPEIILDTTISSLGNCIPNITLQAANTDLFDSFEWQYFNETTSLWEQKSTDSEYKPIESEPGRYKLIGFIACTGTTFESVEIPVSICPDDFDGDLIIDNLDVDIDNDGILNCAESIGNAALNITDSNNPSIIFLDNSTNNTIVSSVFTQSQATNTFSGDINGNFESSINPAVDSKLVYQLNFTQNVNFRFAQNTATNHTITEGEFFIIKIGPNNKNLTLLDPNDQLLIDTNFDGEFETGVTNISASEIHFKFKANLAGSASTFQFLANQINQIEFQHQSSATNSSSTFNGNLQLTCFSLDSDGDGIENMFDMDSDNDGIPDIAEASSTKITLLNTDTNQDGLDDAFNGITTNIDSDNDGIPNYIDLDSDNDGIFDLVEANHQETDTNNDGVLDNADATNVGLNGLLNSLETAVDSNLINYTVLDTDADSIFNFMELDADNDDCFDVTEAGFSDINNDGFLGVSPVQVDEKGRVINNSDGYTNPNVDYITSALIIINTPFVEVFFCEDFTDTINIDTTADSFLWEVSVDGTTWSTITDNSIYSGATTNTLQITNTPLNFDGFLYRVVLERTGNGCPKNSNEITLTVNPAPTVTPEVDLLQCDDDLDRISTVNLTEAEISISANSANERFEYFATEADAIAGTPLVDDELRYPVNQSGEAWVRTISTENCYRISKINLEVEAAADVAYNKEFEAVCDDFLQTDGTNGPANDDTDGITNFDFSEANAEILMFFPPALRPDLEISYFETRDDRTAVVNAIADISNYRNINFPSDVTRQTIYFKITNKNNNNCSGTGELYLRTNTVPEAANVPDLELCDDANDGDGTNGIVQSFDLESQTSLILNGQNPADFTVTYHLSAADANAGNDAQSSPFVNTTRDSQTIFVRVTNTTTGCFTNHTSFNVIVNPIPVANFVEDLEICDDNSDGSARNGFSQAIDLESQTAGILGTQDPNTHTVTYHRSLADAQNGNNPLISPYSNNAPNRETIFVRILNTDTGCANPISNFDVIINAEPVLVVPTNLAYCDNDLDGDDANGIVQNIDLDSKIVEILGTTQNPNDFNVTFHSSQANATSGNDAIISPYQNTNATETIFVRIENKNTGCVNDDATFDVIVNTLPDFTVTTPQILCLNDLPLNIAAENARDVYSYIWQDENGTVLNTASRDNINITSGGTYTVTATTTDGTLCERSESIVVNESNPAILERSFITIIDEGNNISSEDNLSISIDIVNNDLGPGDYQFAIINTDDNSRTPIIGFQDEPLFENLEGGVYQIIVNDKNGCAPDEMLLVSVIQFPKFFTPNGDGRNDTWVVKGANKDFYPNASINIFNRYGTLVAQEQIDSEGWNGMYQGKLLPSDDYWFNITLIPADTTKPTINKKGNFSLLRK